MDPASPRPNDIDQKDIDKDIENKDSMAQPSDSAYTQSNYAVFSPFSDLDGEGPPSVRRISTFESSASAYCAINIEHVGEFNLVEPVEEKIDDKAKASIFRVRRMHTDDLFPYDANTFITWFEQNPTDPNTREDLRYITTRVAFKKQCLQAFPDVSVCVDADYKVSAWNAVTEILQNLPTRHPSHTDQQALLKAKAFVDVETLESIKYVWTTSNFDHAKRMLNPLPPMSWLLRISSRHNDTMPNSTILCICYKSPRKVVQLRCVYVHGVGWYLCDGKVRLDRFEHLAKDLSGNGTIQPPRYVTLIDLLMDYIQKRTIRLDRCLKSE